MAGTLVSSPAAGSRSADLPKLVVTEVLAGETEVDCVQQQVGSTFGMLGTVRKVV